MRLVAAFACAVMFMPVTAFPQAGSTGGSVGKSDKSVSGGVEAAKPHLSSPKQQRMPHHAPSASPGGAPSLSKGRRHSPTRQSTASVWIVVGTLRRSAMNRRRLIGAKAKVSRARSSRSGNICLTPSGNPTAVDAKYPVRAVDSPKSFASEPK
jgi:hypothetical protein